ncbi:Hint domain-containing protein [Albidovulum sp.]|uniref:Hint domain-containing protein n=1 Tax=Albidovulum sp. TaxID=1872424 RepID=UPI001D600069|nr:Hint domain-containing protein [Paracoccaceae bacterium]HPE24506.1 Hint domain-containing protein [Albidovulum sp.]
MFDSGLEGPVTAKVVSPVFGGTGPLVMPAFAEGTMILTDRGERAAETLSRGDRVLTRDNGYRPVLWTGRRAGAAAGLSGFGPVEIGAGALGEGRPARETVVSPDQRLLLAGPLAEALGVGQESLARAADLVGIRGIRRAEGSAPLYVQIALAGHEILCANGAWTESLPVSPVVLASLPGAVREELASLLPGVRVAPARANADRVQLRRAGAA